jgi:hypothetical protein
MDGFMIRGPAMLYRISTVAAMQLAAWPPLASMGLDNSPDPGNTLAAYGIAITLIVMVLLPLLLFRSRR